MSIFPKPSRRLGLMTKSFQSDRRGTVAIIFAGSLIPIVAAVGIAVDYSRALHVRTQLQSATDAAAMAGAVSRTRTAAARAAAANGSFDANAANIGHNAAVTRTTTPMAGSIRVEGSASVPTALMQVVGQSSITVSASSTAHFGEKKLELSIVLDTTGSMNQITSNGISKLQELKNAVPTILDIVMPAGVTDSRVALVPFAAYVNVGSTDTALRTGRVSPYHTKRCVLERKRGSRPNESAPDNNVDEFWIKTSNSSCSSIKPITPLTNNRATLDAAMQNLTAGGSTAGHLGIQWGWHMISPEWANRWPAGSKPVGYTDETTIKAVVVLTDGNFTEFHLRENWSNPGCNGSSDCPESRAEAKNYCDAMKSRLNADNEEAIIIFTIGFGLEPDNGPHSAGGKARNTMRYCASTDQNDPTKKHFYFPVTQEDLESAFASIGRALTDAIHKPRLTN